MAIAEQLSGVTACLQYLVMLVMQTRKERITLKLSLTTAT